MPIPFKTLLPSTPSEEYKFFGKFLGYNKNHANGYYQTKHLVFRPDAIAVRYTLRGFSGLLSVFIIIPLFIFFFIPLWALKSIPIMLPFLILCIIVGLIVLTGIIYCLFKTRNLPVFDTLKGRFYPQGRHHAESAVSTKDIDHLQILEVEMKPGFCYELNAVMKDGNRLHIMAHGWHQNFMKDASQLAENLALSIKDEQGEPYKYKGPLVPGGDRFQSMHLVFRQDSITARPNWGLLFMCMVAMAMGTLLLWLGMTHDGDKFITLLLGTVFFMGGLFVFFRQMFKTVPLFDMVDDMFYPKGFTRDGSGISLKQFDHLEIFTERIYTPKNNIHNSYELNVVLKDGSRYNILDYGDAQSLWEDANGLAAILSLPLVDAQSGLPVTEPPSAKPCK